MRPLLDNQPALREKLLVYIISTLSVVFFATTIIWLFLGVKKVRHFLKQQIFKTRNNFFKNLVRYDLDLAALPRF